MSRPAAWEGPADVEQDCPVTVTWVEDFIRVCDLHREGLRRHPCNANRERMQSWEAAWAAGSWAFVAATAANRDYAKNA